MTSTSLCVAFDRATRTHFCFFVLRIDILLSNAKERGFAAFERFALAVTEQAYPTFEINIPKIKT